jgi:hypothetical protein
MRSGLSRLLASKWPFRSPEEVEKTKELIIGEIKEVLKAQGVENANPGEIDLLFEIQTWPESCYEYAHFTDDETRRRHHGSSSYG